MIKIFFKEFFKSFFWISIVILGITLLFVGFTIEYLLLDEILSDYTIYGGELSALITIVTFFAIVSAFDKVKGDK